MAGLDEQSVQSLIWIYFSSFDSKVHPIIFFTYFIEANIILLNFLK